MNDDRAAESEKERRRVARDMPHGMGAQWTRGVMAGGMMSEVTRPSILFLQGSSAPADGLFAALVLISTVAWGQDESNPHSESRFLF